MKVISNNKKGLSTIVTTLLFVVVGLVAIGGVWMTVRSLLQSNSKQVQTSTLTVDLDIVNAYEEAGIVKVKLNRLVGEGEISAFKFVLDDGTDKEAITINIDDIEGIESFEVYDTLDLELIPVKLIPGTILTVSIAPIIKSGNEEISAGITDTQVLRNLYAPSGGEDGGETPGEDEEEEPCVNDCGLKQCGPSPNGCGGADECGPCAGTCTPDQLQCLGCEPLLACDVGKICGTQSDGCGGTLNCGTCDPGKLCSVDQLNCNDIITLNEGTVSDSWPGSSGLYIGSTDLPADQPIGYYAGKSVKFFDEGIAFTGCLTIANFVPPIDGYPKSHLVFNFETMVEIGFTYKIYSNSIECNAAI